jgi:CheY-like chemotaxis protein
MSEKAKILVAEDDMEDRFIMSETFRELNCEFISAFVEDGSQVVEFLNKNLQTQISLIVLDLNMPRLNGTQTLKQLKSHNKYSEIPVVIFSTSINNIERNECIKLGAHDYITKPSNYSDYLSICREFLKIAADKP